MKQIKLLFFLVFGFSLLGMAQLQPDSNFTSESIEKSDDVVIAKEVVIVRDTVWTTDTIKTIEKKQGEANTEKEEKKSGPPDIGEILSGSKIFWSIVTLIFVYLIIRLLVLIVERFAERSTHYRITLKSLSPFIRILGWIFGVIIVIKGIFKPPTETIFAVMASVGIAVGFAAQDIIKNIFGGIMILFDRPFQVGDKIEVGEYYGEVKEIGLRSTRIVTKDDSMVSIPNAEVVNTAVSNSNGGETNCQVVSEIYLPIDVDTERVRQIAIEAAQVSRYIYLNKPIVVIFVNEVKNTRSFLKLRLKAYVSDIRNEFPFQSDMTELVLNELLSKGIIDKKEIS